MFPQKCVISNSWKEVLLEALDAGLDLASGLHNLLRDEPDLVAKAEAVGRTLHDVRIPSVQYHNDAAQLRHSGVWGNRSRRGSAIMSPHFWHSP